VEYFNHIDQSTAINTQVAYAGNILLFFEFLIQNNPQYKNYKPTDFTLSDLDRLNASDIEEYKRYLKVYEQNGHEWTNSEKGIARKCLHSEAFTVF